MVYCTECGVENPDDALTCKECGATLNPPPYRSYKRRRENDICFSSRSGSLWGVLFGVFILLVGFSFLLENVYGWVAWDKIWPLFIIAVGLLVVFNALRRG